MGTSAPSLAKSGSGGVTGAGAGGAIGRGLRWVERATLAEAKGSVRVVEFAPRHFGLKIVSPFVHVADFCRYRFFAFYLPHIFLSFLNSLNVQFRLSTTRGTPRCASLPLRLVPGVNMHPGNAGTANEGRGNRDKKKSDVDAACFLSLVH